MRMAVPGSDRVLTFLSFVFIARSDVFSTLFEMSEWPTTGRWDDAGANPLFKILPAGTHNRLLLLLTFFNPNPAHYNLMPGIRASMCSISLFNVCIIFSIERKRGVTSDGALGFAWKKMLRTRL